MRFTNFALIDPMMSIGVALFILMHAIKNLKEVFNLFLEKIPHGVDMNEIIAHVTAIKGVMDVHHIHIWSMDEYNHYATMHIVAENGGHDLKDKIRTELKSHNICHVTLELETPGEHCHSKVCHVEKGVGCCHHHHHHHHHH